jgi:hypothetical protein
LKYSLGAADPAGGPALLRVEHTCESLRGFAGIRGCFGKLSVEDSHYVRATFLDTAIEMA